MLQVDERILSLGIFLLAGWLGGCGEPEPRERKLMAMNTGTGNGTLAEQADMLAELGFAGIGWGRRRVEEMRAELELRGLELGSVYIVLDVDQAPDPREIALADVIPRMQGSDAQVWLALESGSLSPSDPAGDERAAKLLGRVADMARASQVEVALYPHTASWMERCEDALRLLDRLEREELGLCFNLCHFLQNNDSEDPAALLQAAGPRLLAVTLNGADVGGEGWTQLIRPLDEGDYDLGGLLDTLDELGFRGQLALQG
ncbi:MAG: TIM barrel protein, partial [Planctomycetota bacterium]